MGGKCNKCGGVFHSSAFDFHHVNPEEKDVDPGALVRRSKEALYAELSKCILLCANCHRIHHWEESNKDTDFDEAPMSRLGLTVNGVTKTFMEWSMDTGIPYETIRARVRQYDWSPERAVTEPAKEGPRSHTELITVDGVTRTIKEWSQLYGIPVRLIRLRINNSGWSAEDAVSKPVAKRRREGVVEYRQ